METKQIPAVPSDWEYGSPLDELTERYAIMLVNQPGLLYLLNRYVFSDIKAHFIAAVKEAIDLENENHR